MNPRQSIAFKRLENTALSGNAWAKRVLEKPVANWIPAYKTTPCGIVADFEPAKADDAYNTIGKALFISNDGSWQVRALHIDDARNMGLTQ